MDDGYILKPQIPLYNHNHDGLHQQLCWFVQLVDIKYKYIPARKMYNTKFMTTVVCVLSVTSVLRENCSCPAYWTCTWTQVNIAC
jgi:hypothetical protein